jgi:hypothetical protein
MGVARRVIVGVASFALSAPVLGISLVHAAPAQAAVAAAPPGAMGYDISYPQCKSPLPTGGAFGIVGVNGGLAFAANPCLAAQFAGMSDSAYATGLYINTGNPGVNGIHKVANGTSSPAACTNNRDVTDAGCAYDYGWMAAADSINLARAAGVPIAGRTWWLDVEKENSWSTDPAANAADLQGAADALYSLGVSEVGIYTTRSSWAEITDDYSVATAAAYRVAWGNLFTPQVALESLPLWIPTGSSTVPSACPASLTGAPVRLAQYLRNGYDANLVCGAAAVTSVPKPKPTKPGKPRSAAAHMAHSKGIKLSWKAPSSNGGATVKSYRVYRGSSKSTQSSYKTVTCSTSSCSWTDTKAKHQKRYYYRIAAINSVGTGSKTSRVDAKGR